MGKETNEIKTVYDDGSLFSEPIFGKKADSTPLGLPSKTEIRYFVGCISDESNRAELEQIMTRSLSCSGVLKKSGDIFVINETGSFDKDGCYQVVVKYLYLP